MTIPPPSTTETHPARRRWVWLVLKWTLLALVLAFVAWRARDLWSSSEEQVRATEFQWQWLLLAALAYAAGWLPSVWFWQLLMHRLGARLRYRDTARAYYCGHLGKYIPGKASVLVIRAALLKDRGFRPSAAALTVAYETLVMMGTGIALGLAAVPLLFPNVDASRFPLATRWIGRSLEWMVAHPFVPALVLGGACLAALPLVGRLFTRIATKMTPRDALESQGPVGIDGWVLSAGVIAFAAAWALHGLSLGCTLQAVTPVAADARFPWEDWATWTGAVALATALGFAALFAPGGIGVRELILMEALAAQAEIAAAPAVVAPVFLRIVWFGTEIVVACVLYYAVRPAARSDE
ncbi:MAG: lysylphosphatidylglycerol synthase domain-containing protein [Planctomycetaceae bacterium]